jgi:hypothetical protein
MLNFNPTKRINIENALNHEYFKDIRKEKKEEISNVFDFSYENEINDKNFLLDNLIVKKKIFEEINSK